MNDPGGIKATTDFTDDTEKIFATNYANFHEISFITGFILQILSIILLISVMFFAS